VAIRDNVLKEMKENKRSNGLEFLVIVPTYNEADNIKELIERIKRDVSLDLQILVIDDGSPDGTAIIVEQLAKDIKYLQVFKRSGKLGLGSAYRDGFSLGIEAGFPFIITMDSDLSHDPIVINDLIAKSRDNDLVIGSRYCTGGKIPNFELWRRWMSKGGNWYAKTLLAIKASDCTSGFRCYRARMLNELDVNKNAGSRQYIFLVEILSWASRKGYRIAEVPITFNQRTRGKTKVSLEEFFHGFNKIIFLFFHQRVFKRKLRP